MKSPDTPSFHESRSPTWQAIHQATLALARTLKNEGPWQKIAAVTRGGMVPTAILAYALEIRHVETIAIASYDGQQQETAQILKACEGTGEGWLVVDDIVDTGKTAQIVRGILPEACFVAIYAKPDGAPFVDHCAMEVPQDAWIAFPWEQTSS